MTTWFGTEEDYIRPRPELGVIDLWTVVILWCFAAVQFELNRPLYSIEITRPWWQHHLLIALGAIVLAWRRRFPVPVAIIEFALLIGSSLIPEVGVLLGFQAMCFFALYSCAAWSRDRSVALVALGAILLLMFGWLAWDLAIGSGLDRLVDAVTASKLPNRGILPTIVSSVLMNYLISAVYIIGAVILGRNNWWQARNKALLVKQATTITAQADALRNQAVTDERLRIARELHDVVAHHVSVMGVQAGAARTVLAKDPALAAEALANVETSSRAAVTEMRSLLGTLRGASGEEENTDRAPEPTLGELDGLAASFAETGLQVGITAVDTSDVPLPIQLSLFRVVQESLNNVEKHSTARSARVTIRRGSNWVEAEILDDGRPKPGTSGSGLGQLGIRERVASHCGTAEIGPRVTGGYRVRVRLPLRGGAL
ncbi:hypothetical protein HMPREF1531_01722 [Propionibacterium sp. oral taxon 192 str. F0372]|uniref:sensor histidine kinase n=1 Tax=Propionibacterium sp. oral taxon 192 TaxID=671222 RepID=UPI000353B584|nr:sensor histidine kinase [Propionibacterium sp. oral taxon 192]EPH02416.1 hypothetical protein HMPREF1531_01722 [Propionibacterium sp. oral taxon 192 str. F0372]